MTRDRVVMEIPGGEDVRFGAALTFHVAPWPWQNGMPRSARRPQSLTRQFCWPGGGTVKGTLASHLSASGRPACSQAAL